MRRNLGRRPAALPHEPAAKNIPTCWPAWLLARAAAGQVRLRATAECLLDFCPPASLCPPAHTIWFTILGSTIRVMASGCLRRDGIRGSECGTLTLTHHGRAALDALLAGPQALVSFLHSLFSSRTLPLAYTALRARPCTWRPASVSRAAQPWRPCRPRPPACRSTLLRQEAVRRTAAVAAAPARLPVPAEAARHGSCPPALEPRACLSYPSCKPLLPNNRAQTCASATKPSSASGRRAVPAPRS